MTDLERVPPAALEQPGGDVIDRFEAAIVAFDAQAKDLAEAGDLASLALGMIRLRDLQKSWRVLLDSVEGYVAGLMPKNIVELDGIGVLQRRKGSAKTHWDHSPLMNAVIKDAFDRGEALSPQDLGDVIEKVAGISYWRVTELKERGIDVDQYRHQEPGRTSVQVHGEGSDV